MTIVGASLTGMLAAIWPGGALRAVCVALWVPLVMSGGAAIVALIFGEGARALEAWQ